MPCPGKTYWFPGMEDEEEDNALSGMELYEHYFYSPKTPNRRSESSTDHHSTLKLIFKIILFVFILLVLLYLLYWIAKRNAKRKWLQNIKLLSLLTQAGCKKSCKKKKCCANKYVLQSVDDAFFVANQDSPQIWQQLCTCCANQTDDDDCGCKQKCKFHFIVLKDNRQDTTVPVDVPNLAEHELIYDCQAAQWSVSDITDPCQQLLNCVRPPV
jgi:hypothetical protein